MLTVGILTIAGSTHSHLQQADQALSEKYHVTIALSLQTQRGRTAAGRVCFLLVVMLPVMLSCPFCYEQPGARLPGLAAPWSISISSPRTEFASAVSTPSDSLLRMCLVYLAATFDL